MTRFKTFTSPRMMVAALVISSSGSVYAQLGSTLPITATRGSSPLDASATVLHQAENSALRWQESTDASQIRVRQYMAPSGQVYAVSWDGPAMPDVAALLGIWFDRYRQGASAALPDTNSLHSLRFSGSGLVVETAVRLRDFSGRAWLPDALPAGVAAVDIE